MTATLSLDGIDPAFLTIDGQRVAPRPRDPAIRYLVAPPEAFDVTVGWHTLRYDLAGAAASLQARSVETQDRTGEAPIEVRVNVPAEGLALRRLDRFLVDPRDIAAPTGTPIYAPLAGRVVAAYPDGEVSGYGNVVTIRSGDVGLLFAHMASMAVRTGQTVAAGQLVGRVGSTNSDGGFHTSGPHLHFEVIAPTANLDHLLAHYTGSTPPRMDPQAWARANAIALVG